MSSWTDEEVAELERKGNDYCLRTWLKNAPPCGHNGRPQPGSDLAVYKRFVVDAYENKRYFGNDDGPVAITQPQAPPPRASAAPQIRSIKPVSAPVSAPPPPVVDLLDFSSPAPSTAAPVSSSTDLFGDFTSAQSVNPPFDAFAATSVQAPANNDLFASLKQKSEMKPVHVAPAPMSAGFNGFGMPAAPAPSSSGAALSTVADFDGLSVPTAPDKKKPIMRSGGQGGAVPIMSAMPLPAPQPYGQMPHQNTTRMQQQSGLTMNQHMAMMSGYNAQMGMSPHMQQQFMVQQQMAIAAQQRQMMVMTPQMNGMTMNQMGGGTMSYGMGGMNGVTQQFGGMTMNNGGMMMGGMSTTGSSMAHPSYMAVPPQQQRQTMSDNAMPGGNVMDMLAYTQKKK